jgi:RHS repeat-associated protein
VSEQRYKPYGEVRWSNGAGMPTDLTFTGQRAGPANYVGSLMDYVARGYSPALGRFISADTIVPGAGNPQAFNRYAYALNAPLRFTDPTGHDVDCERGDGECHRRVQDERRNEYFRNHDKGCQDGSITDYCGFRDPKVVADSALLFLAVVAGPELLASGASALVSLGRLAWAELGLACGLSGVCSKAAEIGQRIGNGLNGNPTFSNSSAVIGSAATRSAGPARTLFRAVSEKELADIRVNAGSLRDVPQSAEGKYFATTYEAAMEWGNRPSSDSFKVLSVEVPENLLREAYYWPILDDIGPAYFITMEQLENYVVRVLEVSK